MYQLILNAPFSAGKVEGEYSVVLNISDDKYKDIARYLEENVTAFKITRVESVNERTIVYYSISVDSSLDIQNLISILKELDASIDFNLVESGVNW